MSCKSWQCLLLFRMSQSSEDVGNSYWDNSYNCRAWYKMFWKAVLDKYKDLLEYSEEPRYDVLIIAKTS